MRNNREKCDGELNKMFIEYVTKIITIYIGQMNNVYCKYFDNLENHFSWDSHGDKKNI